MDAKTRKLDIIYPITRGPVDVALSQERLQFFRKNLSKRTPEDLMLMLRTVQRDANGANLYQRGVADTLQYLLGITNTPPVIEHK